MLIAHVSDLHVLALENNPPWRFLNKRLTGYANLRFKREHAHRREILFALAAEVKRLGVDHLVITGDVTNLAFETEFEAVRKIIEDEIGLSSADVSMIPGNHDSYTRGAARSKRFATYFADYMTSDMPTKGGMGVFPFVRLRGPIALLGLSSAVPRLPLVAAGVLGARQLASLRAAMNHDDVKARTPIVLVHHPLHNPRSFAKTWLEGLHDADALMEALLHVPHGLVLHGHLHRRVHRVFATQTGEISAVGATSASLHHDDADRMAGINLYDFDPQGRLRDMSARVLDPEQGTFSVRSVPRWT